MIHLLIFFTGWFIKSNCADIMRSISLFITHTRLIVDVKQRTKARYHTVHKIKYLTGAW